MNREPEDTTAASDRRSELRMTRARLLVLGALLNAPMKQTYGLEISKRTGLPTGSVYPILAALEQAGWLTSGWENIDQAAEGRRKRRYYTLTDLGRQLAQVRLEETARLITPQWPQWRPAPGAAGAEG